MSDSPAVHAPLDPKEQPILDSLLYIRDKLSLLKQDRSTYIKSNDVISLYNDVIKQVHLLNSLREDERKALEQNRGASYHLQQYTSKPITILIRNRYS
jgi:hypothetical protein